MNIEINEDLNAYRKARNKAAIIDKNFKSRERTSELLGISKDQLYNYETGSCKQIPADIVIHMSAIYNAPELLNNYCCNECAIGMLIASPINEENIRNIYKISISIFNTLKSSNSLGEMLLDIVEDGKITEDEKPGINYIVTTLKQLASFYNDLVLALDKMNVAY